MSGSYSLTNHFLTLFLNGICHQILFSKSAFKSWRSNSIYLKVYIFIQNRSSWNSEIPPTFCVTFWLPVLRSPSGLGLAAGSCPRRPHVCAGTEHHQVQDLSCTTRSLVTPDQSFPQVLGHTLQSNLEISQGPTTVSLYQTAHSLEATRLHGQLTVQPGSHHIPLMAA